MTQSTPRRLGRNGPSIGAIGFGSMGLSTYYGAVASDEERFKVLDLGISYIDSSDIYGDSADLLGKYFKKYPHQPRIHPRLVWEKSPTSWNRCDRCVVCTSYRQNNTYRRYDGSIKGIGQRGQDQTRQSMRMLLQIEYSPFSLDIEHEDIGLLKACRDLGISIVCYSPLGRGMLMGQLKSPDDFEEGDFRKYCPRFSKENFPKNLQLVETLSTLAKKKGFTTGQLTLAWILAQGPGFIPIPGTTKTKNLEENAAAAQIKLTGQGEAKIRTACENADVAGDRYPEALSGSLFADTPPKKN